MNSRSRFALVVWMLILVSVTATDLYYERPVNDFVYQIDDENKIDPVVAFDQMEREGHYLRKNPLFVTLLQYAEKLNDFDGKGQSLKAEEGDPAGSELVGLKEAGAKKWVSALGNNASSKPSQKNRQQSKWNKNKGTSVVCYLKLCSFKQIGGK